ncbi:MAG: EAL domain-containing protein [Granulosicoccus sp.]
MVSLWLLAGRWTKSRAMEISRPFVLASSLVMLSLCTLFLADLIGLRSSTGEFSTEKRKVQVEALAVQLSTLADKVEIENIQGVIARFVLENADVHAAALIRENGVVLAELGDTAWIEDDSAMSFSTRVRVPIFFDRQPWGEVHVVFAPPVSIWRELLYFSFFAIFSLFIFTAFLNRALVQLDPKRAVPGRVDSAMNLFSAGVIVLDARLRIVMANRSAATMAGCDTNELTGRSLDDWPWRIEEGWKAPWDTTLHSGLDVSDVSLTLMHDIDEDRSLLVSCAFVGEGGEGRKGVLVTMDDMTTVERQNRELTQMVGKLRQSQEVISEQNRELTLLATTDPLTGIANRRTLMEALERNLQQARAQGTSLSCIMSDIDHFKQVNDNYGHATGDDVIQAVAEVLQELCRDNEIVGRYGGEEFVVVLPGRCATEAAEFAERARIGVIALVNGKKLPMPELSSSFGVSDLTCGAEDGGALVHAADLGLYRAKESGRNRVCIHDPGAETAPETDETADETLEPRTPKTSDSDRTQARVIELEKLLAQRDHELSVKNEFDSLTGMPLRRIFLQRTDAELSRGVRDRTLVGVISFALRDMDRLVSTFGYVLCDELVINVVERLQNGLRSTDVVSMLSTEHMLSRITSNEYGVLLSSLSDTTSAMIVVTRLKRLLLEPFFIGEEKVYVGATIGIAMSSQDSKSAASLFAEAGEARESASLRQDKVSHVFASNRLHAASDDYIRLESDLHEALENNTIETWFQPKFDLAKRQITGIEALLRWRHETRGFVSPQLFVSVAEANGLIDKLSQLVLKTTLRQIVAWRSLGFYDLRVSVNISPMQLRAETLVQETLDTLKQIGVDGRQLEIELTETTVLDNPEPARLALARLREAGVGISIDDFGTGYTSLSLLADLPLDVVKIDRSFISAVESSARTRAVVGSVIGMAHALNLRVVGEGVETESQLEIISQLGCDEVQGYLISRPLPADKMTEFLINQRAGAQARQA